MALGESVAQLTSHHLQCKKEALALALAAAAPHAELSLTPHGQSPGNLNSLSRLSAIRAFFVTASA